MSNNKKKDGAFAKYMAYIHVTELDTADFEILERQVRNEDYKYEEALVEVYALGGILNTKKHETALATLDETHTEFIKKAKEIIDHFVKTYDETRAEWHKLQPNYKWDMAEFDHNKREFNRFCSEFARTYGSWFWDIKLRHDPLDEMCFGYASIERLQNYESTNWYHYMKDWECLPYGARLLRYYLEGLPDWHGDSCWIDLTFKIMFHRGQYNNKPSKKLLDTLKYEKK